ncbi:alpha/beta hydrolase [Planococcus sp. CPCC 101016]|uniref:alpha/beta hydrolase n=1 Tax=Planococcus sp. CPCC 101016 TaxID=2599617 RepID=UPI0011B627EE|nr:alpha/beta hydrolase [Planococcus sp. CPCC 101016]TWT07705.1 alpha/beta hydrolase [Planococcus sp. CPCC 101016]
MQYVQYNPKTEGPVIVAIPALGERKEIFEALAINLHEFRLIAIDLPGHGQYSSEDLSIANYLTEINKLLNQLSISTAHFVGNSIGAWIIQAYSHLFPKSVLSLSLMDGGYYFPGDYKESEEEIELPIVEQIEDLHAAIKEQVNSMDKLSFSNKKRIENYFLQNFLLKDGVYMHHSSELAVNSLSKAIVETNYCLQHSKEFAVLLLLADQEKEELEKEKVNRFTLTNENTTVKRIPDSYHLLPITNPTASSEHIKNFMMSLNQ